MPCYCRFQKCTICCNWSSNSWVLWVVESRWMARLCLHFSRLSSNKSLWRSPQCWNCLQGVGKNPRTDWPSFGYSGEAYRRGRSQMQIRWSPGLAFLTFFFFFQKKYHCLSLWERAPWLWREVLYIACYSRNRSDHEMDFYIILCFN